MKMEPSLQGRVCLVTGATGGIGKETALALAARGAEVGIVGRDEGRNAAAAEDIRSRSGNANVSVWLADLSSMASIRRFADAYRASGKPLHVLVNNAGMYYPTRVETPEGFERTFALNHLGYFLTTALLFDVLKRSDRARVVNVSSEAHRGGKLDFDDLHFARRPYSAMGAYSASKLANILFTRELARRLKGTGVTANALHPGVVGTNFAQSEGGFFATLVKLAKPFMLSPAKGARTSVYLASSAEVEGLSGGYYVRCRLTQPSRRAQDDAAGRTLWDSSVKATGADLPA